jgi:Tetratricopeptide repeat
VRVGVVVIVQRPSCRCTVALGRALQWAAIIGQHGYFANDQQAALLEESVRVLRLAGDPVELSLALRHLWSNRSYGPRGKPSRDVKQLEESVTIAREAGDRRDTGWGLLYLAQAALTRGDVAEARRLADEALAIVRGLDPNSLLSALIQLGRIALAQGESGRAETVFRRRSTARTRLAIAFSCRTPGWGWLEPTPLGVPSPKRAAVFRHW